MLNAPIVVFPAMFIGAAVGVVVWFITGGSIFFTTVAASMAAVRVGGYIYKKLQSPKPVC
jgi:hypothetical protein